MAEPSAAPQSTTPLLGNITTLHTRPARRDATPSPRPLKRLDSSNGQTRSRVSSVTGSPVPVIRKSGVGSTHEADFHSYHATGHGYDAVQAIDSLDDLNHLPECGGAGFLAFAFFAVFIVAQLTRAVRLNICGDKDYAVLDGGWVAASAAQLIVTIPVLVLYVYWQRGTMRTRMDAMRPREMNLNVFIFVPFLAMCGLSLASSLSQKNGILFVQTANDVLGYTFIIVFLNRGPDTQVERFCRVFGMGLLTLVVLVTNTSRESDLTVAEAGEAYFRTVAESVLVAELFHLSLHGHTKDHGSHDHTHHHVESHTVHEPKSAEQPQEQGHEHDDSGAEQDNHSHNHSHSHSHDELSKDAAHGQHPLLTPHEVKTQPTGGSLFFGMLIFMLSELVSWSARFYWLQHNEEVPGFEDVGWIVPEATQQAIALVLLFHLMYVLLRDKAVVYTLRRMQSHVISNMLPVVCLVVLFTLNIVKAVNGPYPAWFVQTALDFCGYAYLIVLANLTLERTFKVCFFYLILINGVWVFAAGLLHETHSRLSSGTSLADGVAYLSSVIENILIVEVAHLVMHADVAPVIAKSVARDPLLAVVPSSSAVGAQTPGSSTPRSETGLSIGSVDEHVTNGAAAASNGASRDEDEKRTSHRLSPSGNPSRSNKRGKAVEQSPELTEEQPLHVTAGDRHGYGSAAVHHRS